MIIDGFCGTCKQWFDAHFNKRPKQLTVFDKFPCPKCGSKETRQYTDERLDLDLDGILIDVPFVEGNENE